MSSAKDQPHASAVIRVEILQPGGATATALETARGTTVGEALAKALPDKKQRAGIIGAQVKDGAPNIPGDAQEDGSKLVDFQAPIQGDVKLAWIRKEDKLALEILRHSAAHVMADAIRRKWPATKLWVGPPVEDGFYYDVDCPEPITEAHFGELEIEMKKIAKKKLPFVRQSLKRTDALKRFQGEGDPYKVDLLERFTDDDVSLYTHGEFVDLCRGPHVPDTGFLANVKLMKVAGVYWKGDAKNKPLQRIYGTAFFEKQELDDYVHMLEEAKKRDHRKLGKDMDLFSFSEFAPSMPFFHPRGVAMYNVMIDFSRAEHKKRGYIEIITPQVLSKELWQVSGHADYYADNMFFTEAASHDVDEAGKKKPGRPFAIKPMNCPGCLLFFKTHHHSYAELPLKIGEFGKVHRQELSGVTHGLLRVKGFTQDDAHIFCMPEQLEQQIREVLDFVFYTYKAYGFEDIRLELSTRPEKFVGDVADWNRAETALENVLKNSGQQWKLNPGDGAFYGPKIDVHVRDSLKRSWQLGTVQVDFNLPKRFELKYMDKDGVEKQPIMVHRAIYGSMERFYGIVIEHWAGNFPMWLAPVQVKVLPITERNEAYAVKLLNELKAAGLRAEADVRNERIGRKIRDAATTEKVPYLLVVGDDEEKAGSVAVRVRGEGKDADKGSMPFAAFKEMALKEAARPQS